MSVWTWGCGSELALGVAEDACDAEPSKEELGGENARQRKRWCARSPIRVDLGTGGERAVAVACGEAHTLVATEHGDVVSFGRGREGQLGRGVEGRGAAAPGVVGGLGGERAVAVACGAFHSLCATASGKVFEWGLCHTAAAGAGATAMEASTTAGAAPAEELRGAQRADATLARIVRESTERWLTAAPESGDDDGAERRATVGLARMNARRASVPAPRLAGSLLHETIVEVSAGYGHNLARAASGAAYASGYNDRGQCGLGHRVNLERFERVGLRGRVAAVAAGGQHSLAICDGVLFAFGQGALGQLGLGRRVTGRLAPVPVALGDGAAPAALSAGANHSLVLDEAGGTWFFGHAEYGQHGDLGGARGDYVDAEYYCVPRLTAPRGLAAAASGSAHVVAVDGAGRLVTWGWPAFGVLGRGRAGPFLSPGPDVVPDVADVLAVAAGGKHCACVVRDAGSAYAPGFYGPLLDAASGDVRVGVGGAFFRCHRVVLSRRSKYFRGMLAAAGGEDLEFPAALEGGARVTAPLLRSALEYLYTDRVAAPAHRRPRLAALARALALPALADLCAGARVSSTFTDDMAGAVGDAVGADATLRVRGGTVLMAHGAILARYEYFAAMLRFAREQGRGGAIDYAATAPAVARQLLAYVYAGPDAVALDDPAETMALLVAADEARVANLVRLCERSLAARIGGDAGNARAVLEFCDHYASADGKLRAAALHVLE